MTAHLRVVRDELHLLLDGIEASEPMDYTLLAGDVLKELHDLGTTVDRMANGPFPITDEARGTLAATMAGYTAVARAIARLDAPRSLLDRPLEPATDTRMIPAELRVARRRWSPDRYLGGHGRGA